MPDTIPPYLLNEARGWLADNGNGGAHAATDQQVIDTVARTYEGGVAAFVAANLPRPPATMGTPTPQLRLGMVIDTHGMRVLIDREPKVWDAQYGPCFSWMGLVLNPEESIREHGIPRSFLGDDRYDRERGWVWEQTNRWNVQGNEHARWTVIYRGDAYLHACQPSATV